MAEPSWRPAWAEIDLEALRHNVSLMGQVAAPAGVCAVVKADAYGHGAVPVARAAIEGGATSLAVALVEEGVALREADVGGPIVVLADPPPGAAEALVAASLTPTVSEPASLAPLGGAARRLGVELGVHLTVDTGMHRLGCPPPEAAGLAAAIVAEPALHLEGVWTHLAVAEGESDEDRRFTAGQLSEFDGVLKALEVAGAIPAVRHAANSAGAIAWPGARYDLVRCGITLYGELPAEHLGAALAARTHGQGLRPVLSLRARVSALRRLPAGSRPSYGRLRPLPVDSIVATVPLGYADGLPRALFGGGAEVLVGGRRCPLAGMVTMDQIVVDCGPVDGPGATVAVGDEVVLLGAQGSERVTAAEWAERTGTIAYEVLSRIGPRVPRVSRS